MLWKFIKRNLVWIQREQISVVVRLVIATNEVARSNHIGSNASFYAVMV